jgi:LSD1 subclass zinc finger protein
MGIFEVKCSDCGSPFTWWSGSRDTKCSNCTDEKRKGELRNLLVNEIIGKYMGWTPNPCPIKESDCWPKFTESLDSQIPVSEKILKEVGPVH